MAKYNLVNSIKAINNNDYTISGDNTILTPTPADTAIGKELVNAEWVVKSLISDMYLYVDTGNFKSFAEMIDYINTLNATMVDICWGSNVEPEWTTTTTGILTNQKIQRIIIRMQTGGYSYQPPTINVDDGTITTDSTSIINNLVVTDDIKITCYSDTALHSNPNPCYLPLNIILRRNPNIPSLGNSSTSSKSPINVNLTLMYGAGWTGGFWTDEIDGKELTNGVLKISYIPIGGQVDCYILLPKVTGGWSGVRSLGTHGCKISFEDNNGVNGHSRINILGGTINLCGQGYHNLNNVHFKYPTNVNIYGGAMAFIPNKTNVTFNQAVNTWSTNGIIYDGTLTNP
jgi:hypothetical protein